jgi:hypothetical protein
MSKPTRSREEQRRHRYIVEVWIKRIGIPIAIFIVVLAPVESGMTVREVFSWRFIAIIPIAFGIAILASYWMGSSAWKAGFLRREDMDD